MKDTRLMHRTVIQGSIPKMVEMRKWMKENIHGECWTENAMGMDWYVFFDRAEDQILFNLRWL